MKTDAEYLYAQHKHTQQRKCYHYVNDKSLLFKINIIDSCGMESSARTASVSISVTKQHWIISSGHLSESETSKELYLTRKNSSPQKLTLSPMLIEKVLQHSPKRLKKLGTGERNHRMAPYIQAQRS